MTSTDELLPILKKLCLGGVLQTLSLRVKQAVDENLDHNEFLARLLADELERRETKKLGDRLDRANFEHGKTMEAFDFLFNPKIPRSKVIELAPGCRCRAARAGRFRLRQGRAGASRGARPR